MNVKESLLANGSVKLHKVPIGMGAYGVCAVLVAGFAYARSPQKKFLDEIEFLGSLRHPNIVQYLGVRTDPDSNLPILLMELLDESLAQPEQNPGSPSIPPSWAFATTSPWLCPIFNPMVLFIEISPATMSSCFMDDGLKCPTLAWQRFRTGKFPKLCVPELKSAQHTQRKLTASHLVCWLFK